jgi:hypothetical protein
MEGACDPGIQKFKSLDAFQQLSSINSPTFSTLIESNEAVFTLHQFLTGTSAVHASMTSDEK